MTRSIPFILYLLLIALHEVFLRDITAIWTAKINLAALMVLVVAVYKPELVAIWFGFVAGLVLAGGSSDLLGWHTLWLAALGYVGFHTRAKLNLDSLYARLLLVLGGLLVHNILLLITSFLTVDFWYSLVTAALPGAIYTTLLAWLFFLIKEGRITWAKIKALF
jgi:rod shape-determining protein MreD